MAKKEINKWTRWLHIYLSMFSFVAVLFFAVTGITLNHPEWMEGQQRVEMFSDELNPDWVSFNDSMSVDKLQVVEEFRSKYNIKAKLSDFRIEEREIAVAFNGPGYIADAFVDRSSGKYALTVMMIRFF